MRDRGDINIEEMDHRSGAHGGKAEAGLSRDQVMMAFKEQFHTTMGLGKD